MPLADFGPYGVRRNEKGWRRSTSYHPYEFLEGTSEEKQRLTASGSGKRLLDQSKGDRERSARQTGSETATRHGDAGQSRSPFDRAAR
jgi:hypothetical protein